MPQKQFRIQENIVLADYLKYASYISLGIGERGLSPLFRRKDASFRRLLKITGIGDKIGDPLKHLYLQK